MDEAIYVWVIRMNHPISTFRVKEIVLWKVSSMLGEKWIDKRNPDKIWINITEASIEPVFQLMLIMDGIGILLIMLIFFFNLILIFRKKVYRIMILGFIGCFRLMGIVAVMYILYLIFIIYYFWMNFFLFLIFIEGIMIVFYFLLMGVLFWFYFSFSFVMIFLMIMVIEGCLGLGIIICLSLMEGGRGKIFEF